MSRNAWIRRRIWKQVRRIEWRLIFMAAALTAVLTTAMFVWLITSLQAHAFSEPQKQAVAVQAGLQETEQETTEYAPQLTAPAAGHVRTEAEVILDYLE